MDQDRRKFLAQSGASLGGFLLNPTAGILGAVLGSLSGSRAEAETDSANGWRAREMLRSGSPVNVAGHPLGGAISSFSVLDVPVAGTEVHSGRVLLIAGHELPRVNHGVALARKSVGFSVLEFTRTSKGWDHSVESSLNRIWGADSPLPIDGARMSPGKPLYRHQAMLSGMGAVSCTMVTPWNTVLCGEGRWREDWEALQLGDSGLERGWVVESNPFTGSAIKRLSMGRVNPISMTLASEPGKLVVVYLLGLRERDEQTFLFKFVSHQRFQAKELSANAAMFVMGELFVADLENNRWNCLTRDLESEIWRTRLEFPYETIDLPAPLTGAREIRIDPSSSELLIIHDTELSRLKESGVVGESEAFELERNLPLAREHAIRAPDSRGFYIEHQGTDSVILVREPQQRPQA